MRTVKYRWRVHLSDGTSRDVTASTEDAAGHTALYAERLTGNRTRGLRVASMQRLFAVGWAAQQQGALGPGSATTQGEATGRASSEP